MTKRRTWEPPQPTRARRLFDYLETLRFRSIYRQRLKTFMRARPEVAEFTITKPMRRDIEGYWRQFDFSPPHLDWYRLFYALTGQRDPRFVPEETFRVDIERWLNCQSLADAYSDKNLIDRRFADASRPKTVLRRIHGHYFTPEYGALDRRSADNVLRGLRGNFIVKPSISATGSGQNVNLITIDDGVIQADERRITLEEIEIPYGGDFLVQEKAHQHAEMAAFHDRSFNTCRIITLRVDDDFKIAGVTFRMGNGSYVDNGHAGGLLCGVNIATGALTAKAVDVRFVEYDQHPRTGVIFAGRTVYNFDQMKALALRLHRELIYFDMVSFDIGLGESAVPCLIEVNLWGQGIEPHQVLKGEPLFGNDTDAILRTVAARRRGTWG